MIYDLQSDGMVENRHKMLDECDYQPNLNITKQYAGLSRALRT